MCLSRVHATWQVRFFALSHLCRVSRPLKALAGNIMKTFTQNPIVKQVTLDGMITLSMFKNGMKAADFQCSESVNIEAFSARCKVQAMRNGNVYISQLPTRKRNKPLFRDDNCSLSLGQDGRYYFSFSLPAELIKELPGELVRQASAISGKVIRELL